jgi:hypothetical protein
MVTYSTKQDLVNKLSKQFNHTIDNTSVKVRISKNTNTSIKVNEHNIVQSDGQWHVHGKTFHYKKSAVGYVISLINKKQHIADQIEKLDFTVAKLTEDIVFYKHSMRIATKLRKNILSCRISEDFARLEQAKNNLHTNLVSINLT